MKIILILFLCLFATEIKYCKAGIVDLGTFAETYPIIEDNALEVMQTKAKIVDLSKILSSEQIEDRIKNFKLISIEIPRACKHESFNVRPTHTLDFDILDQNKKILYPKGYTFRPLDYVKNYQCYVIINGEDKDQIEWFENASYKTRLNTTILITQGNWASVSDRLERRVFYAVPEIIEKFKISAIPAVVTQIGESLNVEQIPIK